MIYFYGYLGVGVLVLGLLYLLREAPSQRAQRPMVWLFDEVSGAYRTTWGRRLETLVVPAFAWSFIVICWPVAGYCRVKELISGHDGSAVVDEPVFEVKKAHLLERLSLKEIEAREPVFDPLGTAPSLPFGHLNEAWRAFVDRRVEGDVLWSFSADWQTAWGASERRAGYVLVRGDHPSDYFLTKLKDLPRTGEKPGLAHERAAPIYIPTWLIRDAD